MPSIAIYGDSGMGKTMIMEKFRREHPPLFDGTAGVERTRVLALQMAGKPGERRLYAQILTALGAPQNPRAAVVDLEQVAVRLMRAVDVHVLVLDEVHNILAGTFREQRIVLNTLRYLSNELKISLVCFGVKEAREAISGDVQLARRFEEFPLPRWSAEEGFEQLVLAIIRNLPLRQPTVLPARAVRKILQVTDGITSKVFRMLKIASPLAYERGGKEKKESERTNALPAPRYRTSSEAGAQYRHPLGIAYARQRYHDPHRRSARFRQHIRPVIVTRTAQAVRTEDAQRQP